ncbi:MAG: hypothetical protein H6613_18175 [Ignavibacteriales bacterium]|nr:hypothetical protein [Ignavibacteriales bacterium]
MKRTILLIIVLVFALGLTSQINAQVNYHTGTIEFTDVSQNIVDNYPRGSSNIFIKLDDTDLDADAGSPSPLT